MYQLNETVIGRDHRRELLRDAEDVMDGTEGIDIIVGLDSTDEISGLGGPDRLVGDGNGTTVSGDDELFGGPGGDELLGNADSDLLSGGKGGDEIAADFLINDGTDDVKGNDIVNATEGTKDVIDCGDGLDKVKNCEVKDPL